MLHGKTVEEQRALREAAMSRTTKTIIILSVVFLVCNVTFAGSLFGYTVRYFQGRVSNCNQSETRIQCFLACDWLKFDTLDPREYLILYTICLHFVYLSR